MAILENVNVQYNGNFGDVKSLDTYRAVVPYMVYSAQPVADGRPQGQTTHALRTPGPFSASWQVSAVQ